MASSDPLHHVPPRPDRPAPERVAGRHARFVLLAAALILVGSFLPWLGRDGRTTSSWDLPVLSLMRGQPAGGVRTGPLLLLVALLTLGLAAALRLRVSAGLAYLIAVVPINAGIAAVMASLEAEPHLGLGPGAILTLVGGLVLAGHALVAMYRTRAAARAGGG